MPAQTLNVLVQAVLALALLGAYTALTITNHDATILLGLLGGQGLAVGGTAVARGVGRT